MALPIWLVEASSTCKYPCHFSWQPSPCYLFAVTWPAGAWRQGRAGRLWNPHNSLPSPPPQSFVLQRSLWGPGIRLLASRCQRDTFLFALSPKLPSVCPGGGRWQRLFWNESFSFLPSLSSLYPLKPQEHFGFFPSFGVCVGDLSMFLFTVNSLEVNVGVQSLNVSCPWGTWRNTSSWLHWWWRLYFDPSPCSL